MKKILMFLCCVFTMMCWDAHAVCKLIGCARNGDFINAYVSANPSNNQCWWCGPGPNSCGNRDVVPYKDSVGDVTRLYICNNNTISAKFTDFTPGVLCKDSQLYSDRGEEDLNVENAKKTYSMTDATKTTSREFGDNYLNDGSASCIFYKCYKGYSPSADRKSCVSDKDKAAADAAARKVAEEKAAAEKKAAADKAAAAKAAAQARTNRDNCENTGGSWSNNKCTCDSKKFLQDLVAGKTCECVNGYRWDSASKGCVITDIEKLKQICDRHTDVAHWSSVSSKCICDNDEHNVMSFDYDKELCVADAEYVACVAKKSEATWSAGKCNCNKVGYVWRNGGCEESNDLIQQREDAAKKQRITKSTAEITNATNDVDGILAGLKLTVWKDKDGNFNVARLASDSIAGVVLGTAGGLIMSHVVKKNQVKKGFEDVQCTVGGQKVADWGDEFTVGIQ